MKPTVRVSIGGLAFNLEEDAYRILDNYLKSLRRHFHDNPESEEIIADIEIRLSELLQMRIKGVDSVVSDVDAQEITQIMGNPKDFDDSESAESIVEEKAPQKESNEYIPKNESQDFSKKKLYRDEDNKIIGGVFGGLGNYFKIDPTILRVGVVALILLLNFLTFRGAGTIVLAYIILWIVMPAARTFTQKLAMTGADPSIVNIEDRTQTASLKHKSSASGCLGVFINIIAIFIIVVTLIIFLSVAFVLTWSYFDTDVVALPNYLAIFGYNTVNFKIAVALAALLPLLGLICLMVKIVRRTPFTTQTLVSFVVGLIFWFGATFYLTNQGVRFAKNHRESATVTEAISMDSIKSDTLRIKLTVDLKAAYTQPNNEAMFYKGDDMDSRQIWILPRVKVNTDSTLTGYKIEIKKNAYADAVNAAEDKVESMRLKYTQTGSLITIEPESYDMDNTWDMQTYEMIITAPPSKKVIVDAPLKDKYRSDMNFSINPKTFRRYDYNNRRYYYFD